MKLLVIICVLFFAPREENPGLGKGTCVAERTFHYSPADDASAAAKIVQFTKRVKRKAICSGVSVPAQSFMKITACAVVLSHTSYDQFSRLTTEGHDRAPPVIQA